MTTTDVESQLTFLYDTLIDLATSADRQAARKRTRTLLHFLLVA